MTLAIGSLFSGIGGLDLSVEAHFASLGFDARTIWQVEHDAFCNTILARHFPGAARSIRDVRAANAANLAPIDALAAGLPCQPVSLAGKRKAREDARWLWPECARIIGEFRPRYVFLENVPGLLTADDGRAFGDVLGSLASLGYDAGWDCLRASDVGAPHRRERWFLLGWRQDVGDGAGARRKRIAGGDSAGAGRVSGVAAGAGAHVADPNGGRREQQRKRSVLDGERTALRHDADGRDGASIVAHAERLGPSRPRNNQRPVRAAPHGERQANRSVDVGHGLTESRVGGAADGLPCGVDIAAHRWPAARGEAQHEDEAPRITTERQHRRPRLKALGNAVVPQQAALAWRVLWDRMTTAARVRSRP